jgi:hypothetical protein
MNLFTQNSDLRKSGIWGWTIPAHNITLSNGERFNTCPNAGICGAFCYAKNGTYLFPKVKASHLEKLEMVLGDPVGWAAIMVAELHKSKYKNKFIRIHDAGDFFADWYAHLWLDIATMHPDKKFYTYTKEVAMFQALKKDGVVPSNFITIYSFGGKQDHLINRAVDRHSDVFPNYKEMLDGGYVDIADDDSLDATSPNHRIGLYRNNIPHFIKKMGNRTFAQWQGKFYPSLEPDKSDL